jgi:hypothetical protein
MFDVFKSTLEESLAANLILLYNSLIRKNFHILELKSRSAHFRREHGLAAASYCSYLIMNHRNEMNITIVVTNAKLIRLVHFDLSS